MRETTRIRLPATSLGHDRCFGMRYTHHGDIQLHFWNGNVDYDNENTPPNLRVIQMSHSSDVVVVGGLIRYYRQAGKDEAEVRQVFQEAAQNVLTDPHLTGRRIHYGGSDLSYIIDIAEGQRMTRFDIPYWNLECIYPPLPTVPGTIEEVGGTGMYTRQDILGNFLFVLTTEPFTYDEEGKLPYAELTADDIPMVAKVVCDMSLGEYRRDIFTLIKNQFPDEA